ncbi:hypothetical protein B9P99_01195 [Candidatus Marsarchaeota G1 archaeon OSP_B]|jgi:reactive intermediate/imine deaminase|uniref:Deaminase n=4 Tax=Candidatus Marsarchaeota group 1 TaxID=2203770 RepID=A0A2R6AK01_9ARCH|nr:MAG: hypothetical protein B9Q01_02690 [Candidatus Marsarchaeota G1 archaeon OSP_D]PSN86678.1 MAG: hypothetical protein B9Q02_01580 [Candidatus Marsarchaeota G1 archaeon BE_D]PSN88934.1 MAG: hypothetical protein B9Q00_03460 [Candidatus Marsarchaeota G1 archaeon OSP_C]PSN95267.1 MAG: hypothetical protein B9P99_01195 [Candidatus Marsarchaeota G1 archaeon OSP_B]
MPKKVVQSQKFPKPVGPYSVVTEAGGFVFVSGQVALDRATGQVSGKSVAEQTRTILENIKLILEECGASLKDVVKANVYLADISTFNEMNEVYKQYFPENPPARTTVQATLAKKEYLVEIDVIAYKG